VDCLSAFIDLVFLTAWYNHFKIVQNKTFSLYNDINLNTVNFHSLNNELTLINYV